jgi:hypothetical protein
VNSGPVFVAGLERSGTSLLYALLASHPDIAMSRRTNLWRYVYRQYGDISDPAQLDRCLDDMRHYKRLLVLDLDFEELRASFLEGPRTYPRLFELVGLQVAAGEGKPRWGDKSLLTERFAALIFESYPGARILHMMRDPRDRFASSKARWGRRLGGVGAGTAEWIWSAELGLANQEAFPGSYRVVRYEDLVTDPRQTLAELCDFIDAPWAEEMLGMEGAESFRDEGGNSSYGSRPAGTISSDSIGRYRSVLSPSQIDFVNLKAAALMERLGYAPDPIAHTLGRWIGPAAHPIEMLRFHSWRGRDAVQRRRPGSGVPEYRLVEIEAP